MVSEIGSMAAAFGGPRISRDGSAISAWVVATDEELMIARHAARTAGVGVS
jgi:acetate kinase